MRSSIHHILILGICTALISFTSCSRSLTDVGYSSFSELQYNTLSAKSDGRDYFLPTMGGTIIDSYRPSAREYKVYNFVTDNDIEHLYNSKIAMRLQLLSEFYSQFSSQKFNSDKMKKEYLALMSPQVKECAESYNLHNNNPLGIWQVFKPYPGLDIPTTRYKISYQGNDWFSIKQEGDDFEVRLRILLVGKHLRPVVAEIENPSLGIIASLGAGLNLGCGYSRKGDWDISTVGPYQRSESYKNNLASIVYKYCTSNKTTKDYVTEKDILLFADKLVENKMSLLNDMYVFLSSASRAKTQYEKRVGKFLSVPVRKALEEVTYTKSKEKHTIGKWKPLEPRNKNNYQIVYDKKNWFKVTGDTIDSPDLYLQVVFYGRKLYPLITGICNKSYNLSIYQDFESNRSNNSPRWGW